MSMNILPNYISGRKSSGSPILPDFSQTAGNERAQQSLESEENRDRTEEGFVEIDVDLDPEEDNEDEDEDNDAYLDPWAAGVDPNTFPCRAGPYRVGRPGLKYNVLIWGPPTARCSPSNC